MKFPITGLLCASAITIVSRKLLRERAVELAAFSGRPPQDASKSDWDQAKQELMPDTGHRAFVTPSEDEDAEGRIYSERLVEQGIAEAERDQLFQAAEAQEQADNQEATI